MQNELQQVKESFDSNNMPVSIEFLECCIDWCRDNILDRNYGLNDLRKAVYDQWLSLDLRETEVPILPSNISNKKYMVLSGNFSLQVMHVVDISKPKYWQLQQIRKENILTRPPKNEINDSVGTGKRVLQLTLTDGVQYIQAMEYKPIPKLNINIVPGCKVRLSGPVTIRRGQVMLEEQNISVLGGEVESLMVPNAAENILARVLKLPENPNPQMVDANLLSTDEEPQNSVNVGKDFRKQQEISHTTISSNHKDSNPATHVLVDSKRSYVENKQSYNIRSTERCREYPTEEDLSLLKHTESHLEKVNHIKSTKPRETNFVEPTDEEIEMLMQVEEEFEASKKEVSRRSGFNKTPDLFEDDIDPDQLDNLFEMTNIKEKNDQNQIKTQGRVIHMEIGNLSGYKNRNANIVGQKSKAVETEAVNTNLDDFLNEDDLFNSVELPSFNIVDNKKSNIIFIKELKKRIENANIFGSFKIKARFKSVEEKLTMKDKDFKLVIKVQDSSDEIICRVHSDVVSTWAGLSPEEIISLKTNVLSQDFESKKKVEQVVQFDQGSSKYKKSFVGDKSCNENRVEWKEYHAIDKSNILLRLCFIFNSLELGLSHIFHSKLRSLNKQSFLLHQ